MADNVGYTEGVGTLVATDDVGGVQYQVIKLDIGGDGASSRVVGTFPISASSLPLPSGAATSTDIATIVTALALPLPTGANTIGGITNTAFGISGTLPAFAATPTFNLGTLNGAALDATLTGGTQRTLIANGANNAAVKAASTAAVAADPALVVTVSPNTPLPSGTNSIGSVRIGDVSVSSTLGGFSTFHTLVSAATTNATSVKATPGTIAFLSLSNTSATVKYFKLCNTAAAPTPGSTSPVFNIMIPASSTIQLTYVVGHRNATGISYMITGGSALLDTTAVAAGDVLVNIGYN